MKKTNTILILFLLLFLSPPKSKAQSLLSAAQPLNNIIEGNPGRISRMADSNCTVVSQGDKNKGSFYVIPFYQFTRFKELKLTAHTSHYMLFQGDYTTTSQQSEIDGYNNNYGTEYQNNMYGLRVGYRLADGLGISGFAGFDQFSFKSWISPDNTEYNTNTNPAFTIGLAIDYERPVYKKLLIMGMFTYNYFKTGTAAIQNNSGDQNSSVSFKSSYWEINVVLGYPLGNFLPYAGAGYTQIFVNAIHDEQILTKDNSGNDYYNRYEFNSDFKGKSLYGFAGLEYSITKNLSVYGRSSFMNPLRANFGIKILL
jgi:hypothetical protein